MVAAGPILRAAALRELERKHADQGLMERAGAAVVAFAEKTCRARGRPLLIVAGPGNNGGDALVAARLLHQRGELVHLVLAADPERLPADARVAHRRFLEAGGVPVSAVPADRRWDLVIDGLFGIGLGRPVQGHYAELVDAMEAAARASDCPLLALDCPSGLNADTGEAPPTTLHATYTLTFIALKPGLLTGPGLDHCGELALDNLGLDPGASPEHGAGHGLLVDRGRFAASLHPRRRDSHKGSFGSAGILGGASEMVGAALLAGRAALKLGAGRVFVGLLDQAGPGVDPVQPELMIRRPERLFDAPLTALAVGPGLGSSRRAGSLLARAIGVDQPLLLDADALNLIADDPTLSANLRARAAATVITPHPGEAARLLGGDISAVQADRLGAALALAQRYSAWTVLKGAGTVIAAPDQRWWINTSGNPGLATAGSGDTLSGIIVALLAQGWPIEAATLGAVHLHGAAAEEAAREHGTVGLTASELPDAARRILNRWIDESGRGGRSTGG